MYQKEICRIFSNFPLPSGCGAPYSYIPSFDQRGCALASAPPHLCQSQAIARPSGFSAHPKSSDQALQGVLHLRTLRNQKYPSCSTVTWEPAPAPLHLEPRLRVRVPPSYTRPCAQVLQQLLGGLEPRFLLRLRDVPEEVQELAAVLQ